MGSIVKSIGKAIKGGVKGLGRSVKKMLPAALLAGSVYLGIGAMGTGTLGSVSAFTSGLQSMGSALGNFIMPTAGASTVSAAPYADKIIKDAAVSSASSGAQKELAKNFIAQVGATASTGTSSSKSILGTLGSIFTSDTFMDILPYAMVGYGAKRTADAQERINEQLMEETQRQHALGTRRMGLWEGEYEGYPKVKTLDEFGPMDPIKGGPGFSPSNQRRPSTVQGVTSPIVNKNKQGMLGQTNQNQITNNKNGMLV